MQYNLVCFKPGDQDIFSVDIDENKSVDQLKQEIKKKLAPTFNAYGYDFALYKVNVDISDYNQFDQILKEISRSDYVFPQLEKLAAIAKISQ
jgi:hypothetical protein